MKTMIRGAAATLTAGLLLFGSTTAPAVMAQDKPTESISIQAGALPATDLEVQHDTEKESLNPLAPQQADAAWWHFTVREWGAICGFHRTQKVGPFFYSHEVKRWAYGWDSSKPKCQQSGERLINQYRTPKVHQPGTLVR